MLFPPRVWCELKMTSGGIKPAPILIVLDTDCGVPAVETYFNTLSGHQILQNKAELRKPLALSRRATELLSYSK